MEISIDGKPNLLLNYTSSVELRRFLENELGLKPEEYYLLSNGKLVDKCINRDYSKIHIVPRVLGGKGGFGSMLRAIGAQIEKTTNREACRDLSGRRLRDINEEQRLKNWINQQAEREKEAKERKQKKLERLCETPKHVFKDEQYDKERSELPEAVEDAVIQGLQASCSSKRKTTETKPVVKKKKAKLWVDDELEDLSSSEGEDDNDSEEQKNSVSNDSEEQKNSVSNDSEEQKNSAGSGKSSDSDSSKSLTNTNVEKVVAHENEENKHEKNEESMEKDEKPTQL